MISANDCKSALLFLSGRISEKEFLASFPFDPRIEPGKLIDGLEDAKRHQDPDLVEIYISLGYKYGIDNRWINIFCELMICDWHHSHGDIISAFQFDFPDDKAVRYLKEAALKFSDDDSLGVKCVWALWAIKSPDAIKALRDISVLGAANVAEKAKKRLEELARSHPGLIASVSAAGS